MVDAITLLETRRSASITEFTQDNIPPETLQNILKLAARVSDHKKLVPWRFLVIGDNARALYGEKFAEVYAQTKADVTQELLAKEKNRFLRSDVCVVVVFSPKEHQQVPEIEQLLSTGAACQNLLLATHAYGYAGVWFSGWAAFEPKVKNVLGLHPHESIAGFFHLGKTNLVREDRERPDMEKIVSYL